MENIIEKLLEIEALIKKQYVLNKDFLTLEEAAGYVQLSKSALYKLTSINEISYSKPGGKRIYIARTEIDRWLASNRTTSVEELNIEVNKHLNRNLKP